MYNYRRRYVVLRTRCYLRITTLSPLKINVVNYFPTNELRRLYMEERYYHLQNSRIKRNEEESFSTSLFSYFYLVV